MDELTAVHGFSIGKDLAISDVYLVTSANPQMD